MDHIVSLYWDNIDPRVVKAQRDVFAHFGLSIDQRDRTGLHSAILNGHDIALDASDKQTIGPRFDVFPADTDSFFEWPWLRQTPDNDGRWEDFQFQLEDPNNETEWLVVFDEPSPSLKTKTPYERRILFVIEPPEMKSYKPDYVNQFRFVVCP
jgi:hypothetical protein